VLTRNRSRLEALCTWLLPAGVMLAACLIGLDRRDAWRDEHASWWSTTLDGAQFWHLMSNIDAVLGPYYLLLRGWVHLFGDSLASLRFPSSLAMTLCALLVTAIGRRLANTRIGLVAGLLLAVLPSTSRYGQEARPYAFAMAATSAALLLLLRALERPERRGRWLAYALGVTSIGAFHLVALASLLAHPLLVLEPAPTWPSAPSTQRRLVRLRWLGSVTLGLALLAPLTLLAQQQRAQVAWTLGEQAELSKLPQMIFHSSYAGIAVLLVALCALRPRDPVRRVLGLWSLGATLFLYATHSVLHFFIHRYLLFTLPGWCLLAALSAEDLARKFAALRSARAVPALLVLLVLALGFKQHGKVRDATRFGTQPAYASAAAALRAKARPGDAIAYGGTGNDPNWTRTAMYYELQDAALPRDVFVSRTPAAAGRLIADECQGRDCLPADVQRLWFLTSDPAAQLFAHVRDQRRRLLAREFDVAEVTSLSKLTLALLVRKQTE
jgi:mannosyltransferase